LHHACNNIDRTVIDSNSFQLLLRYGKELRFDLEDSSGKTPFQYLFNHLDNRDGQYGVADKFFLK